MSTIVSPMICDRCGGEFEPTPAALAAGGRHPHCVVPASLRSSLRASAGPDGPDVLILSRWALRRAQEAQERHKRREASTSRVLTAGAARPGAASGRAQPERRLPDRIVNAVRMLALAENAGPRPDAAALQRDAARLIGDAEAAETWATLTTAGVLRVSSRRLARTVVAKIDRAAWATLLPDLLARERRRR